MCSAVVVRLGFDVGSVVKTVGQWDVRAVGARTSGAAPGSRCAQPGAPGGSRWWSPLAGPAPPCTCTFMLLRTKCGLISSNHTSQS